MKHTKECKSNEDMDIRKCDCGVVICLKRSFDGLIIYGIGYREGLNIPLSKHEIESEMPWHFKYRGVPFSQEAGLRQAETQER